MTTVKHVLDQKGHDVHFIHPDASVFDALKMMAESNIGSLVVLEDGKLVGVITERHYAREISRHSRRIDLIERSTYPFCHGDRGAIGRSRMPIARSRRVNASPKAPSVSRMSSPPRG